MIVKKKFVRKKQKVALMGGKIPYDLFFCIFPIVIKIFYYINE